MRTTMQLVLAWLRMSGLGGAHWFRLAYDAQSRTFACTLGAGDTVYHGVSKLPYHAVSLAFRAHDSNRKEG